MNNLTLTMLLIGLAVMIGGRVAMRDLEKEEREKNAQKDPLGK